MLRGNRLQNNNSRDEQYAGARQTPRRGDAAKSRLGKDQPKKTMLPAPPPIPTTAELLAQKAILKPAVRTLVSTFLQPSSLECSPCRGIPSRQNPLLEQGPSPRESVSDCLWATVAPP